MKEQTRHPSYLGVFLMFARNSAIRDMTFRGNFLIQATTGLVWMLTQFGLYQLIFQFTDEIGSGTGWQKYPFFAFLATTMIVNSIMQTFVMPNAQEFSELIRTGNLDFALLKPIDTQFLVSFHRIEWSALTNFGFGALLLSYSLTQIDYRPSPIVLVLYPLYLLCGVAIMYSVMISLAATSVWMGRNQSLYNFWFYITSFSRYPMEIYRGPVGDHMRMALTFILPILLAINVPARIMVRPLADQWFLAAFTIVATAGTLGISRLIFVASLSGYRSASS